MSDTGDVRSQVRENLGITAEDIGVSESDGEGSYPDTDTDGSSSDQGDGLDDVSSASEQDTGERPQRRARDQYGREPKQQRQQQQPQQRIPSTAEVRPDARGNLIDGRGNVVARAGKEARFYQQAVNASRHAQSVQAQAAAHVQDLSNRLQRAVEIGRDVYGRFERLQAQNEQIQRMGISPQEQLEALQLVAMSKTNPVQALKTILTRAAANGIDLSELGMTGSGDMKSLADMLRGEIQQHMQPLRQRTEAEARQEQLRREQEQAFNGAKVQVAQFFAQNPGARDYLPVLDAVLQRYPQMSLGEIWAKLQLHLAQRQMVNGDRTRQRGAFPNGRGRLPPQSRGNKMAPVNQTYEQIARSVMAEAGM